MSEAILVVCYALLGIIGILMMTVVAIYLYFNLRD